MFFTEQFIWRSARRREFPSCLKQLFVGMSQYELLNATFLKASRLPVRELALTHELKQEDLQNAVSSATILRGA